jgi:hypothetical protein
VALDGPLGPAWTLAADDLRLILRYALDEPHDLARARALVEAALDRAAWTHLASARLFFVLGAFWFFAGATAFLDGLRAAGLRLGVLAYDTIPCPHPEHTDAATVAAFRQALAEGAGRWDFVPRHLRAHARGMRDALGGGIPVAAVPLAHRFGTARTRAGPAALAELEGETTCSPSARSRAARTTSPCSRLGSSCCRGRRAAAAGARRPARLAGGRPPGAAGATAFLGGRIRLVHGISDPELLALYRGCLFSIFPSFTEGWGLPVGESLALGKPCLASRRAPRPRPATASPNRSTLQPARHRRPRAAPPRRPRGAGGAGGAHPRGLPRPRPGRKSPGSSRRG